MDAATGRIVIVGAGHAGVEAAEALRREGHEGAIVLVDAAPDLPYQRPPLSKEYVAQAGPAPLPLRGPSFYSERRIELRLGEAAARIDRARREVELEGGERIGYDALVLAVGAHGRVAACEGADLDGIIGLRTVRDAEVMRERLERAQRVVVVGAGFIGLEFASAAEDRGVPTTVIDFAARPMQRVLSPAMSARFGRLHTDRGATLVFGEGLERFESDGQDRVGAVVGTSGTRYPADLVVVGLGVVPAVALAEHAGLRIDNGIAVDETLRSSDPAIFAIGDCASYPSAHWPGRIRLEAVQNATDQARTVARSILGRDEPYTAVPWFWTVQAGEKLQIAGIARPDMGTVVLGDPSTGRCSVLGFSDGTLVCVESVQAPADHMAARRILAGRRRPTIEEASAEGFSLKAFAAAAG
ncbi:NAD(P)/FAD-dependent oxidoreductase [Agrococcus citreus]|uniref:FAD-dependent oxidoreductase n=1 Tax=Agrococcus citreus TaxID=84643 RepID=A0ABN1YQP1_9MICO